MALTAADYGFYPIIPGGGPPSPDLERYGFRTLPGGAPVDYALTSAATVAEKSAYATLYSTTPAAVYDPTSRKTFIAYLGVARGCYVTTYDHATGAVAAPVLVGSYATATDDNHGAPSIAIDGTGRLCVIWGHHNGVSKYARTTSPRDITAWTVGVAPNSGTYTNLRYRAANSTLYLFMRSGTTHDVAFPAHEFLGRWASTDGGATWGSGIAVMDVTGFPEAAGDPYVYDIKPAADGAFWFAWSVARGASHDGTRLNVYCARYDPAANNWANAAGTSLGSPLDAADHDSCLVATTGVLDGANVGATRVALHPSTGRPWVVYTDAAQVPHVAEWTGNAWSDTALPITQAYTFAFCDLRFRTGGALDVYVSGYRPDGSALSNLVRYSNASGSWALAGWVAYGEPGTAGVERAQVPLGAPDSLAVLYQSLSYDRSAGNPTAIADTTRLLGAPADLTATPAAAKASFVDTFDRANSGSTGNGWTEVQATTDFPIESNQMRLNYTGGSAVTAWNKAPVTMLTADQFAQAVIAAAPGVATTPHPNVGVRWVQVSSTDQSGYYARWNPTGTVWQLYRLVSNTSTLVGSLVDTAPTVPYVLRVEVVGSTITAKVNGVTKVTATDATLTAGRAAAVGMRWTAAADHDQRVDNFTCGDL